MKTGYPINGISTHTVCDMWGCDLSLIEDENFMRDLLEKSVKEASGTILQIISKKFEPQGLTLIALLAESHMSIHTWPEHDYVGIDIFTCGDTMEPHKAITTLTNALNPTKVDQKDIRRGLIK